MKTTGKMSAIMCTKPRFSLVNIVKGIQAQIIRVQIVAKSFYSHGYNSVINFIIQGF